MSKVVPLHSQLFSRLYLEKGKPQPDSERFRIRVAAQLKKTSFNTAQVARLVAEELGVNFPQSASSSRKEYYVDTFVRKSEVRDLLDFITLVSQNLQSDNQSAARQVFTDFIERAMREEGLGYRIDQAGGVHFYIDEEFERSRVSILLGLSGAEYLAAREAFQDAHKALLASDTLSAVRRSFDAVENVFKVRFGVPRLGASEIKSKLAPRLSAEYSGRVADAASRLSASFAEWTNAAHQFRHAPGEADPSPPPLDIAVVMVASAATNLRWLLGLPD